MASRLHSLLVLLLVNVGAGACVSLAYAISAEAQVTGDEGYMPWQVCGLALPLEHSRCFADCSRGYHASDAAAQPSSVPCQLEALPRLWTRRSLHSIISVGCQRLSALPFAPRTAERAVAEWYHDQ